MRFVAAILAACLATSAFAEEARKIDFTTVLLDQDGKPMLECADVGDRECKEKKPLTLGAASMRALAAPEQGLDPSASLKRGQLALSVYKSTGSVLTAEDITLIKTQISKIYTPLVSARAFPLLDPASGK